MNDDLSADLLVERFFSGDDGAWEELVVPLRETLLRRLRLRFGGSSEALVEALDEWLVTFFENVLRARRDASAGFGDDEGRVSDGDGIRQRGEQSISLCEERTGYKIGGGTPFAAWAWTAVKWRAIDLVRGGRRFDDDADLTKLQVGPEQGEVELDEEGLKKLVEGVFEGDQLVYFELLLNAGQDLPAKVLQAEVLKRTGRSLDDRDVSNVKKRFRIETYLRLIELGVSPAAQSILYRRIVKSKDHQEQVASAMCDTAWRSVAGDRPTYVEVFAELPTVLSLMLRRAGERPGLKLKLKVLRKAFQQFRRRRPKPRFCHLIETYVEDRLGDRFKAIFFAED
jgi:hypothetical protein